MCKQDIEIGRRRVSQTTKTNVPGFSAAVVLKPRPDRLYVRVSALIDPSGAFPAGVLVGRANDPSGEPWGVLSPYHPELSARVEDMGDVVTGQLVVYVTQAVAVDVCVTEVFLDQPLSEV